MLKIGRLADSIDAYQISKLVLHKGRSLGRDEEVIINFCPVHMLLSQMLLSLTRTFSSVVEQS